MKFERMLAIKHTFFKPTHTITLQLVSSSLFLKKYETETLAKQNNQKARETRNHLSEKKTEGVIKKSPT